MLLELRGFGVQFLDNRMGTQFRRGCRLPLCAAAALNKGFRTAFTSDARQTGPYPQCTVEAGGRRPRRDAPKLRAARLPRTCPVAVDCDGAGARADPVQRPRRSASAAMAAAAPVRDSEDGWGAAAGSWPRWL